jgi:tRNA(Ile)-lysidine synthase
MHPFERNLITEWRRLGLPESGSAIVIAASGGADSLSLLLALHELKRREKLRNRLIAAHFNHMLRANESDDDEEFVRRVTEHLGIELAVGRGPINKDGNLEQNARAARYEFLRETGEKLKAFAVLTGHTIDDQAETFLLNLIRGSGPDGLRGMRASRALANGDADAPGPSVDGSPELLLVRPMLGWARRKDTENYCREINIEFREDAMNEDLSFKRVRVRKLLIPMLEDFNPKIVETLARTAALMGIVSDAAPVPADKADEAGKGVVEAEAAGGLAVKELRSMPKGELFDVLRQWLKADRGDLRGIELKHIEAIERLIHSRKSGRMAELPNGTVVIKGDGRLRLEKLRVEKSNTEN